MIIKKDFAKSTKIATRIDNPYWSAYFESIRSSGESGNVGRNGPMMSVAPIVCLLLGWGEPAGTPETAPRPEAGVSSGPSYVVMQVKSGTEIVVKIDGKPTTVRLLGIDTPQPDPKAEVDTLSPTRALRHQVAVGDKVRLSTEDGSTASADGHHLVAQVYRASDGLWLNRDMIEKGYAATDPNQSNSEQAAFQAAEAKAKAEKVGMWSPSFVPQQHSTASKPARPATHVARHRQRPTGQGQAGNWFFGGPWANLGGGLPGGGAMMPAPNMNNGYGYGAWSPPFSAGYGGLGGYGGFGGYGVGGFGYGLGGGMLPLSAFSRDQNGNALSTAQTQQRYNQYLAAQQQQQQQQQHAQTQQLLSTLQQTLQSQAGILPGGMAGFGGIPMQHMPSMGTGISPGGGVGHLHK
jgi:micrococcal nuclease